MPYKIEKSSSCKIEMPWAVIKTSDGSILGCHATQGDAEKQLAVLYSIEPSAKYEKIDFKPPQGVQEAARRGLEVRESKPPSERGGTAVGIARARDLSNGKTISPDTARRMHSYFSRHEVDKKGSTWDEQGKGWQAWMLWGGDPGQAWAGKLVRQMNAEDEKKAMVKAEASNNEIKLYGPIGYPGITAQDFKNELQRADKSLPLVIRIDSEGGSVFDGLSIYDAISNWPSGSKAIIESAAFSIASFIPMAADEIEITENGYLMLHNPYTGTEGDSQDHQKISELLSKLQQSMISAYADRTGKSPNQVQDIMAAETWYTAAEAKEVGLVDKVLPGKKASRAIESRGKLPQKVFASLSVNDSRNGTINLPPGESKMAEQRVAASVKAIKAKFPNVSDSFVVKCMEQELPMEDIGELLLEELQSKVNALTQENQTLAEQVMEMKAQMDEMSAKAAEEMPAVPAEEEKPAMKVKGVAAVRTVVASTTMTNTGIWKQKIQEYISKGISASDAVRRVNRENPGLRVNMLAEQGIK